MSGRRTSLSRRLAIAVAAGLLGVLLPTTAAAAVGLPTTTPAASARWARVPGGAVRSSLAGARTLGPLPATRPLHLDVTLRLPDAAAVRSYIADITRRGSPLFHHFLTPGEFGRLFGPTSAEVRAVRAALRSMGLAPGPVAPDHLSIPVTATAAVAARAFRTRLVDVRLPDGRLAYTASSAPSVPAGVAGDIAEVVGLSDVARARPAMLVAGHTGGRRRPRVVTGAAASPQACSAAGTTAADAGAYTPAQLAAAYGLSPLYSLGDFGQNVTIALVELASYSSSDIAAYQSCFGTDAAVSVIPVDGGAGALSDGSIEDTLDIEDIIGLAPQATIDVYESPNSGTYADYSAIINADTAQVISTSWGECEPALGFAAAQAEQSLFEQAATQGQTVLAAAGDSGSEDCYAPGTPGSTTALAVDDPGSQPYVVGVGGTSLTAPPYSSSVSQTVWNDASFSGGAGGGGISQFWSMPGYQADSNVPGIVNPYSTPATCGASSGYCREGPDVSADANPETGYVVYYTGPGAVSAGWQVDGGTSAAAPLWAAVAALTDASPFCADYHSGDIGVSPPALYAVAGSARLYPLAFADITSGNNDYTGTNGGAYPATPGFDMASGLGTPIAAHAAIGVPGLTAALCYAAATTDNSAAITSISPATGPLGTPVTVTITGSGFLPIAGADRVDVGGTWDSNVSCSSTTQCTVVLPAAQTAQTVALAVSAEELTTSPAVPVDEFTYGSSNSSSGSAGVYTSLTPTRIVDTRPGSGYAGAGQALGPGASMAVQVAGVAGVPTTASAVVLNVTVTDTTGLGYLTVWPDGATRPTASVLNWTPGKTVADLVTVGVPADGQVDVYNSAGTTDVIVDVEGYYAPSTSAGAGLYNPLATPARICDTRTGNPSGLSGTALTQCQGKAPAPGTALSVQVAGLGGVPSSGVAAVVLNLTAVSPTDPGYLTAYPAGGQVPIASSVNYAPGQTVANRVIVGLSSTGAVDIYSSSGTPQVVVDVSGWYTDASDASATGDTFTAESAPVRICDTRSGNPSALSGAALQCTGKTLAPGSTLGVQVTGLAGVPSDAAAVLATATVTNTTGISYLTLYPAGLASPPVVSDLNWTPGLTVANMAMTTIGSNGEIEAYNNLGSTDVILDVAGWFTPS